MVDESKLNMALEAYTGEDFVTASAVYNDLLLEDSNNPYLLINSGISDYKIQNIGQALMKLYQAKKFLPRNKIITNNIEIIEEQLQLNNPKVFTLGVINLYESLVLLLIFNIIFFLRNKLTQSKFVKFFISLCFVISLVLALFTFIEQTSTKYAFVTNISATTYSGNNKAYSEMYEVLDGQMLKVVRRETDWSQIKYDGQLAWIENENIAFLD
jgi:hypothetical protein